MHNHGCRVRHIEWLVGEHHLRLGAEEEICSSMSVLASCLSTNEKEGLLFYTVLGTIASYF